MTFHDHFSSVADTYARYRPRYPAELFVYLASVCQSHDLALDCATGNGQAAVGLAAHFAHVVATDASESQIAHAVAHPRITYRVAPVEQSGLAPGSTDLVTVAQAMHWLDPPRVFAEVRRVSKPGGVLAVFGYERLSVQDSGVQAVFDDYYERQVGALWPPGRGLVEEGYRSVEFPFDEVAAPGLSMTRSFVPETLAGYAASWSATRRYREATGVDPIPGLRRRLEEAWPAGAGALQATWPIAMRIGRVA